MGRKFLKNIRERFRSGSASPSSGSQVDVRLTPKGPTPTQSESTLAQLAPSPLAPSPPAAPSVSAVPQSIEEIRWLVWNEAYERAKEEEPKVVDVYETVLSAHLAAENKTLAAGANTTNDIAQDADVRKAQMKRLVEIGLQNTDNQAKWKQGINDGIQIVNNVKVFLSAASKADPSAAVAWSSVVLCMEMIANPLTEPGINREGIKHVLARIQWYWELSRLLLNAEKAHSSTSALQMILKDNIVKLYKNLLLYQMQSVCLYSRSWAAVIVRDLFKLDNWQERIDSIKKAEDSMSRDIRQYGSQELQASLRNIEDNTKQLREDVKAVGSDVREQTQLIREIRHDEKDQQCLRDLRVLNPETHKKTIQATKGGLLKDSYRWILEHDGFCQFRKDPDNRLLWIKGDPGKGKTMLLCGIIDELQKEKLQPTAYFFCQATQAHQLRSATAVIRSLIWLLCDKQPQLVSHVRERYDKEGKDMFEDVSAMLALKEILMDMLQSPCLESAMLVIDALDECADSDRTELIGLIVELSQSYGAKWIISSRNWPEIEEQLQLTDKVKISLELNKDTVSKAVNLFIDNRIEHLSSIKKYTEPTKQTVIDTLRQKANNTFLWVALVCAQLARPEVKSWNTIETLNSIPEGLNQLYKRMFEKILNSYNAVICKKILATVCIAYRLLTLEELQILENGLDELSSEQMEDLIGECGSFLTTQSGTVYFVHQSAQDFLLEQSNVIFPAGMTRKHQDLFEKSLDAMSVLERDIYRLASPGVLAAEISPPHPDPLSGLQYSCVYWIKHLENAGLGPNSIEYELVDAFLKEKLLFWLEALSLLRKIPEGVIAVQSLATVMLDTKHQKLQEIVQDVRRFSLSYKKMLEIAPLQVYVSALAFCPTNSKIKGMFDKERWDLFSIRPDIPNNWDTCIQTLEGHNGTVTSLAFTPDGRRLISGSDDETVMIWDTTSSHCIKSIKFESPVKGVVVLRDGQRLVAGLDNGVIELCDLDSGLLLKQTKAFEESLRGLVSSLDTKVIASYSIGPEIKLWDPANLDCIRTIDWEIPDGIDYTPVYSAALSADGLILAACRGDFGLKVWDMKTGECIYTIDSPSHHPWLERILLLPGNLMVAGDDKGAILMWDTCTGDLVRTRHGHGDEVSFLANLDLDQQLFISASNDTTIGVWNHEGECARKLNGHRFGIQSLASSTTRKLLASGSTDQTVKVWDLKIDSYVETFQHHEERVNCITLSPDGQWFASGSGAGMIKIWDAAGNRCVHTFHGHNKEVNSLAVSSNGLWLLSTTFRTAKVWNTSNWTCAEEFDEVDEVALSPNGDLLALNFWSSRVWIYELSTGVVLQKFKARGHTLLFSPNNLNLVVASLREACICEVSTGRVIWRTSLRDMQARGIKPSDQGDDKDNKKNLDAVFATDTTSSGSDSEQMTESSASDNFSLNPSNDSNLSYDQDIIFDTHSKPPSWTEWHTTVGLSNDSTLLVLGTLASFYVWNLETDTLMQKIDKPVDTYVSRFAAVNTKWFICWNGREVAVWDMATGVAIGAVESSIDIKTLRFVPTDDSRFCSEMGVVEIRDGTIRRIGYGLSDDGTWVMKDNKRVLWLPPEYRSVASVWRESVLTAGCGSGRILVLDFENK